MPWCAAGLRCSIISRNRRPGAALARVAGLQFEMELAFAALHQLCASMAGSPPVLPEPQRDGLGERRSASAPDRRLPGWPSPVVLRADRVPFFLKTEVVDTEGRREECIEGPSFASSRADRSQGRGSENAGAPVSRTSRRSRQAPQAVSLRMILSVSFEARR